MDPREEIGDALFAIGENLKAHPDSPHLLGLMGMAYGADQRHERARHYYDALTRVAPEYADGLYQLSCNYSVMGQHDGPAAVLRKAYALNPNDASTALNLGLELLRIQDTRDEALTYLRRAERLGHRRAHGIIEWIASHEAELRQASGENKPV